MPAFLNHTDFTNGYRINYPADWQRQVLSPTIICFFAPRENPTDIFFENVNINVLEMSVPLQQLVDMQIAQIQSVPTSQMISRSAATIAGLAAEKIEFSGQLGPAMQNGQMQMLQMQWLSVFVPRDKKIFNFTYTAETRAYNKYLPLIQQMLSSLEFN